MSRLRKWNTILYILNILACLIILFDAYFGGTYNEVQQCKKKDVFVARGRSRWSTNYQITTTSGAVFNVTSGTYFAIAEQDTFIAHRTRFLGNVKGISFHKNDEIFYLQLGPVFNHGLGLLFFLAPLLTCLVLLFYTIQLKREIELRHALLLTVICLLVVYIYIS